MPYIEELRAIVGHRPLILIGTVVMIFDKQDRMLFQHRTDDGTWGLPGGYLEPGESLEQCAMREIKEETGLEAEGLEFVGIYSGKHFFLIYPNGDEVYSVWVVYVARNVSGSLKPDMNEGLELEYFPCQDMPANVFPQIRLVIEDFFRKKGGRLPSSSL